MLTHGSIVADGYPVTQACDNKRTYLEVLPKFPSQYKFL